MIRGSDYELLLGAKKDPNFGPVILFGMGGILAEALKDRNLGLPPLNRLLARRLMEETKVYSLLQGYRNRPPADLELLEETLIRLSQLLVDFPQITDLDMNPVMLDQGRPSVVDARVFLERSEKISPLHLVIGPYPAQFESQEVTSAGVPLVVRPIKPEDAPLFQELFDSLSATSIYYRFFSTLKSLSPRMLARFTQIDYEREIALVALKQEKDGEKMVGVCRIVVGPDGKQGEFAVLVGDPWQRQGIGAALLQRCLDIAKERGIDKVEGIALRENRQMLALARKLGFDVVCEPGTDECDLSIQLRSIEGESA